MIPFTRVLSCFGLLLLVALAHAQDPNAQLFKVNGAHLSPTIDGTLQLKWLPRGGAYLEAETLGEGEGFALYAVDPVSQERSPVFDKKASDALINAFNTETGGKTSGIPFESFTRELDGRAIRFVHAGDQFLFDLKSLQLRRLVLPEIPAPDPFLSYLNPQPVFSPDFNQYAYVQNNEIFVADTHTGATRQLTQGAAPRTAYGQLGAGNGLVFSPDGRYIAFLVSEAADIFAFPQISSLAMHPDVSYIGYPFAADPNTPCSLNLVEIENGKRTKVLECTEEVPYIRDLRWRLDGSELLLSLQSRWFDKMMLKAYSPKWSVMRDILLDEVDTFMNANANFRLLSDNQRFVWSSERSGFQQIYLYGLDGEMIHQVTDVPFETSAIQHIDETQEWVYFQGYPEDGTEIHLYRVKFDGSGLTDLTPAAGTHQTSMDPAGIFFTDLHSTLSMAPVVSLHQADGKLLRRVGAIDVAAVKAAEVPDPELIRLKTADGQSDMLGMMYKPVGFDAGKKYPLLVYVYGGPHSKSAYNAYQSLNVNTQMAQFGFIVVQIDARGTPGRGLAYQTGNYLGWGQNDVDDQAAAVRQLAATEYIDASRVGIFGISHGGYMTLMAMLRYPDVFKVGVSGAPITILEGGPHQYISRPMRTPEANPEGYKKASVLNYVDNLQGKLLIYHGTSDQNALMFNSMLVADALIKAGKPFDYMVYPEGQHVMGGQRYRHVMTKQLAYFLENLQPEGWEAAVQTIWSDLEPD